MLVPYWDHGDREIMKIMNSGEAGNMKDSCRLWSRIFLLTAPAALIKPTRRRNARVAGWEMNCTLQRKGTVSGNPKSGLLMLNPAAGTSEDLPVPV